VSLAERVSRCLGNDGALTVQHAAAAIRHQLDTTAAKFWTDRHVTVGARWRLYAEYPDMPRLRDRAVLDLGLTGPQLLLGAGGLRARRRLRRGERENTERSSCRPTG
jgi:hypothetical protein